MPIFAHRFNKTKKLQNNEENDSFTPRADDGNDDDGPKRQG